MMGMRFELNQVAWDREIVTVTVGAHTYSSNPLH